MQGEPYDDSFRKFCELVRFWLGAWLIQAKCPLVISLVINI